LPAAAWRPLTRNESVNEGNCTLPTPPPQQSMFTL